MFISPAFADTAASVADPSMGGSALTSLLPMVLILGVFYVLIIRPQNKRLQEHRAMVGGLQKGDMVVTGGGLVAKVVRIVNDDEAVLELSPGVEVRAVRSTIMVVRGKDEKKA